MSILLKIFGFVENAEGRPNLANYPLYITIYRDLDLVNFAIQTSHKHTQTNKQNGTHSI